MEKKQHDETKERGNSALDTFPVPKFLMELQTRVDAPEHLIKETYSKWVDTFEQDSLSVGYASHILCSQAFNSAALECFKDAKSIRIIDVGAGTGVVGGLLKDLGYANIDAIDCCDAMLQKARDRKIYKNTFVSFVDERKNEAIEDGMYDALISSAAISPPLIQPRAFDEMIRWVKKGGVICFTIRRDSLEEPSYGYSVKFQKFQKEKKWQLISNKLVDYYRHEGSDGIFASKAYVCVYQVL